VLVKHKFMYVLAKERRTALEKYCGLDTEGMIWIIDEFKKKCNK